LDQTLLSIWEALTETSSGLQDISINDYKILKRTP